VPAYALFLVKKNLGKIKCELEQIGDKYIMETKSVSNSKNNIITYHETKFPCSIQPFFRMQQFQPINDSILPASAMNFHYFTEWVHEPVSILSIVTVSLSKSLVPIFSSEWHYLACSCSNPTIILEIVSQMGSLKI
jgi:hypothetical protein